MTLPCDCSRPHSKRARSEGHAARQGIIHGLRAAIALAMGSLHDAEVEAETGLVLLEEPHFAVLQLVATGIVVQVERGALETAAELAQTGERLALSGNQGYAVEYMTARGRLRIAQGDVEAGVVDLLWCGEQREALGMVWPSDWKTFVAPALASLGETSRAEELAREHLAVARRVGAAGGLGKALRAAALASDSGDRLALLEEALSVLEHSPARLELAHALADLGAELNRRNRRREGREAERRAIKLAGECGAAALARKRAGGAARRARPAGAGGVDGAECADRSGVARMSPGGRRTHEPRDRRGPVRDREDDRTPPQQRLPEAGDPVPFPARGGHRALAGPRFGRWGPVVKPSGKHGGAPPCMGRPSLRPCPPVDRGNNSRRGSGRS